MSKLYSLKKVMDNKKPGERLPFEVPYYKMVESSCGHPSTYVKNDILCIETIYVDGLIKCPKCGQLYRKDVG